MMKRSFRGARTGVGMTFVLGMFAVLSWDCGTIGTDGFLGLETCDVLNCDGLFFANLADAHDDMADMDGMDDADTHEDEGDDHMDDMDGHDDDDDDNAPMNDMDDDGDDASGPGAARS